MITRRETQILDMISKGFSTDEVSKRLFISHHTVETHRKNLLRKLQVQNSAQLVRRGFELGCLKPEILFTQIAS